MRVILKAGGGGKGIKEGSGTISIYFSVYFI